MVYNRRKAQYRAKAALQAAIRSAIPPQEVTDGAACSQETAHLFEPDASPHQQNLALQICNGVCPVREACLIWAIDNPSVQQGVSGGVRWPGRGHKKRTA